MSEVAAAATTTSSQEKQHNTSSASSKSSSPSNSISLIKLDELSSFGATKQSRLPALIKLNNLDNEERQANSMPALSADQLEKGVQQEVEASDGRQQHSLPATLKTQLLPEGKENLASLSGEMMSSDGFQVVSMEDESSVDMIGPSLPQPQLEKQLLQQQQQQQQHQEQQAGEQRTALANSSQQLNQHPSHLGDSLIDMIVNLRNENQNLVRALETNNEYVKERLSEFKRANDEAKRREAQFALEKAEHEHQVRKLQRQNMVLSERLKSMEAKLKDMKLEVSESLLQANSSKASSVRGDSETRPTCSDNLYPNLGDQPDSFGNSALANQVATMQVDATSGELYNGGDHPSGEPQSPSAPMPPMETDQVGQATASTSQPGDEANVQRVAGMSKDELRKHFDADKAEFYAMDDPMKQCDQLEKQLNDIGKRDYEICLLQQQLNIYRQDFRLERMANLEAKIQIEKLKNDIDRLCLERLQERNKLTGNASSDDETRAKHLGYRASHHRASSGSHRHVRFDPAAAADAVMSKLGHQLNKKAAKSAAKAAKYASKQAHREEKAAAVAAAAAAAAAKYQHQGAASSSTNPANLDSETNHYSGHRRHHSHHGAHRGGGLRAVRSEVVNDLLSTANKAMLTGYKMASTHVNLALDKLSAFEQAQASNLAANKQTAGSNATSAKPSAPPAEPPSID